MIQAATPSKALGQIVDSDYRCTAEVVADRALTGVLGWTQGR